MKNYKKIPALTLAAVLCMASLNGCGAKSNNEKETPTGSDVTQTTDYGLCESVKDGAILHCFSWSFNTIAESMEDIAMAGYSAIQTSPINACYDGGDAGMDLYGAGKWYYHYQPTDWTIGNYQLGTRDEFKNMCDVAESYGIKVIVDVAPNHTTKSTEALGEGLLNAVGGIDNLYHKNGKESITDYSDRTQCTLMAVGGLYDVNTENEAFQKYFIDFMNDCIACGADGFRFDTAKHIGLKDDPQDDASLPNNFWENVLSSLNNKDKLFIYGEVLQDGGERIKDYIDTIGGTTASSYGSAIRGLIQTKKMDASILTNYKIGDAKPNIVTWVESHDNYTGDDASYKIVDNTGIILAWTAITATGTGTPLFFSRPYNATADSVWGTFNKIGMSGDFLYKEPSVVAVNRFRNAMAGEDNNVFNPEDYNRVVFIERGTKGLVIVNAYKDDYSFDINTNLAAGTYTDRISGTEFTVADGKITGTIKGYSTVVLYNENYVDLSAPAVIKVSDETSGSYKGDSTEAKIVVENATEASYSIDGGDEITCKNGDVITIGEGKNAQETTRLTLKAKNAAGNTTTISYIFKKQETIHSGVKITFVKPDNWKDEVYAYIYDETTDAPDVVKNAEWPGVEMQHVEGNIYEYTFDDKFEKYDPLVIFTDGDKQSNGAMEPGAAVEAGKEYSCN